MLSLKELVSYEFEEEKEEALKPYDPPPIFNDYGNEEILGIEDYGDEELFYRVKKKPKLLYLFVTKKN